MTSHAFIYESPKVASLVTKLSPKREIVGQLTIRYQDNHTKMVEARQSLGLTQMELDKAVISERERIFNKYTQAKGQYEETQKAVDEVVSEYTAIEARRQENQRLEEELNKARKVLDHLEFTKAKVKINIETKSSTIEKLTLAEVPEKPFYPNFRLNLLVGNFLGISFGLFMAYATSFLGNRRMVG